MEKLLACRVCLATDTKLFDMYNYGLATAYETLTGTQMLTLNANLPHQLCSFCSSLLLKSVTFQRKCLKSQKFMNYLLQRHSPLSTDFIRSIDRVNNHLMLPYTVQNIMSPVIEVEIKEEDNKPNFLTEDMSVYEMKFEEMKSSDEEPLSKMAKKRKKRKHKEISETDLLENVTVKDEIDFINDSNSNDDSFSNDISLENNIVVSMKQVHTDIEVVTLSKEQQVAEVQARKDSVNYLNSFYKCELCFKGFMTDTTYKNHMAKHDPTSGAHACDVCHTRWPNKRTLRAHLVTSHVKKYVCRRCNHISNTSSKAKEHCKWHDGFVYTCNICGASFSKSTTHLTHIRLQHPSSDACDVCGETFIGEYGVKMHKKFAHRHGENPRVKSVSPCVTCGVRFKTAEARERHLAAYKDNICDTSLRSCIFCGEGFLSAQLLREHQKVHQREEAVSCTACNRKFGNTRSYSIHYQRVHLRVVPRARQPRARAGHPLPRGGARGESMVCEVCGNKCTSKVTLMYHLRTHTGEKPYQCAECPKRFSIYQRLQIHRRTHTGERPFKCSHCPKAFKHKAALNRHDRVHTGAKPYACQHCGKTFSQSNSMKMHVLTVHLKMPSPYKSSRKKGPDQ